MEELKHLQSVCIWLTGICIVTIFIEQFIRHWKNPSQGDYGEFIVKCASLGGFINFLGFALIPLYLWLLPGGGFPPFAMHYAVAGLGGAFFTFQGLRKHF